MTGQRWKYRPEFDSDGEVAGIDHLVVDCRDDEVVVARNEKEGRLIAAAPQLLAVLKELVRVVAENRNPGTVSGALFVAESVIAEAEGQS